MKRLRNFFLKHPVWNSRDVRILRLIIGLGWAVVLALILWELGIFGGPARQNNKNANNHDSLPQNTTTSPAR